MSEIRNDSAKIYRKKQQTYTLELDNFCCFIGKVDKSSLSEEGQNSGTSLKYYLSFRVCHVGLIFDFLFTLPGVILYYQGALVKTRVAL